MVNNYYCVVGWVVVVGAFVEKDRWLNSTTSQDVGTRAVRRPRRRRKFVGAAADFCWSAPTPCRVASDFFGTGGAPQLPTKIDRRTALVGTLGKSFTRNCLYGVMWRPVAAFRLKFDSCSSLLSSVHSFISSVHAINRSYINANEPIMELYYRFNNATKKEKGENICL